jgi:hypothetical protein
MFLHVVSPAGLVLPHEGVPRSELAVLELLLILRVLVLITHLNCVCNSKGGVSVGQFHLTLLCAFEQRQLKLFVGDTLMRFGRYLTESVAH